MDMISRMKSRRSPVTTGTAQGSVLGPILSNVFMKDLDNETEGSISTFLDDTKLGGVIDRPASYHRDRKGLKPENKAVKPCWRLAPIQLNHQSSTTTQASQGYNSFYKLWSQKGAEVIKSCQIT
ncbi:hypothetical protein WISP_142871 [Willisornis vidua]|uniref:Reverse transcriptase domain-containing protein n=1 Tax=Willisornis vidua TaxID=1566151 RepID=A0ABQ9CP65_9PASS|nr:hypothetical protein WISP_142871 [Willisornis vidua]